MAYALQLLAWFVGGAALLNALPHLAAGLMGRKFPSPFAKPPGKGLSSAVVNTVWGFANLVLAWLLIAQVGRFDIRDWPDAAALGAGMLLLGWRLSANFGSHNDGRGPRDD